MKKPAREKRDMEIYNYLTTPQTMRDGRHKKPRLFDAAVKWGLSMSQIYLIKKKGKNNG